MLRKLAFVALLALVATPSFAVTPSYYLSANTTFAPADLACNCSILVAVAPGNEIIIDLPAALEVKTGWNPALWFAANNAANTSFTVRVGGVVILDHFTTRGAVARIAPSDAWWRIQ